MSRRWRINYFVELHRATIVFAHHLRRWCRSPTTYWQLVWPAPKGLMPESGDSNPAPAAHVSWLSNGASQTVCFSLILACNVNESDARHFDTDNVWKRTFYFVASFHIVALRHRVEPFKNIVWLTDWLSFLSYLRSVKELLTARCISSKGCWSTRGQTKSRTTESLSGQFADRSTRGHWGQMADSGRLADWSSE